MLSECPVISAGWNITRLRPPRSVGITFVLQPAINMLAPWVTVRPVNKSALGVRFVLAIELDRVAWLKTRNSWGKIDVVSNQQCSPGIKFQNETLVTASIVVVRKHFNNYPAPLSLRSTYQGGGC